MTSSDPSPATAEVPSGFEPLGAGGPYFAALGPSWRRDAGDGTIVIGLRAERRHANMYGNLHGGMLLTLADSALGFNVGATRRPRDPRVTVSLNADFLDAVRPGEWLEARVTLHREGSRLSFADCVLTADGRIVLRASGVFSAVAKPRVALPPAATPRGD